MTHDWLLYITAFSIAFGVCLLTTPMAKKAAKKLGAIDYPKSRGLNKEPMPLMGGLAMVAGFFSALIVVSPFLSDLPKRQFVGFIIGGILIVITGMFDDAYELSPKVKFSAQFIVAVIVVLSGIRLDFVMYPLWEYLKNFTPILTVIWIIGIINAVNLIDGVDGLAAGVTSISSICLMILCITSASGTELAVVLTAALAGSCLGFLPRNFSPAEIYMGDTGSTFLGYVLGVSSCIGVFKSYAILSIVIAVLAMALPILDTAFAIIRRAVNHKPIMMADRGHLHHRLIDSGYTHRQAVIILYGLSSVSGIVAILIAIQDYRATIVVAIFFVILIVMLYTYRKRLNRDDDKK
ncbi:MAG: undecaprenyl/decaprenyl-phosphate alpha-N-acetylglucosaminyl 1-phosphate transferase [Clostridiales bacterium]|nr:undecaprenyl/decaprenyl-phosphate alpha-N-acetylglucosaminyl 1-phosphate transferase [Clostridiales bacterium]